MMSNPSMIGPSLPPNLIAGTSTNTNDEPQAVIGPQLPLTAKSAHKGDEATSKVSYGPSLPPGMTYGPLPPEESEDFIIFIVIRRVRSNLIY